MRAALTLSILLAASGLGGCRPKSTPEGLRPWPDLPITGFTAGRAATKLDVKNGNAVFSIELEGRVAGEPLTLEVPQFAIHVDADSGAQTRVIIVQAERAAGGDIIGYRTLSGQEGMGLLFEFRLLGTKPLRESSLLP